MLVDTLLMESSHLKEKGFLLLLLLLLVDAFRGESVWTS